MLKNNLTPTYKYVCNSRILANSFIDSSIKETLSKNNQILDSYSKFSDFQQCFSLLPLNGLTIIVQLSRSKTELYFGCYLNSPIPEEKRFIMKKRDLSKTEFKSLLSMKKSLNKVKKNILKTPFEN